MHGELGGEPAAGGRAGGCGGGPHAAGGRSVPASWYRCTGASLILLIDPLSNDTSCFCSLIHGNMCQNVLYIASAHLPTGVLVMLSGEEAPISGLSANLTQT